MGKRNNTITILVLSITSILALGTLITETSVFAEEFNGIDESFSSSQQFSTVTIASSVTTDGTWFEFTFTGVGVDAKGCKPADPGGLGCVPSSGTPTTFAPAPPWTFSCFTDCSITLADAFALGDRFTVFDFGASIGTTSVAGSGSCGNDPEVCLANPSASSGVFNVGGGPHSLTIKPVASPFGAGAAYFKIEQSEEGVLLLIITELKEIWEAIIGIGDQITNIGDQITNIGDQITNIEETVTAPALASFIDTETINLDGYLSAGDFKLLMDITPFESIQGHVAMKVPCDKQGNTDLAILTGVAPAVTPITMNFVGPLSDPGTSCLYHGDIGAGDTDVALINTGKKPVNFGPNEEGFSVTITIQGTE